MVTRHLRDQITRGDLAPGQPLPEVTLAAQLRVSRGTVREAWRALAEQGLIDIVPHRGAFVADLTPLKARELFTVRAELEAYAVRLAFARGGYDAGAIAGLAAALADLIAAADAGDNYALADADMRFHDRLTRASGHGVLLDILGTLRVQMLRLIVYTKVLGSDREPEAITHRRLLDAIRAGDAETAVAAVHHHVTEAGELLVRQVEERERARGAGVRETASAD